MVYDFTIIGAGIVGLSVGFSLIKKYEGSRVLILEKEKSIAKHQTGRNSGVIHSGIYYEPGSLKAELAKKGNKQIVSFCKEHNIPYNISGKLIAATKENELENLNNLYERGLKNGLKLEKVDQRAMTTLEPNLNGIQGIHVQSTGVVDYKLVAQAFAKVIKERGGEILLEEKVKKINNKSSEVIVETSSNKKITTKYLINCSGLMSDLITKKSGTHTDIKIVPFRGEYYELKPNKRYLVKNLIYPVPNPDFPFLGVHFTKMIDGRVLVGPNAVLSLKREGYKKISFSIRDSLDTFSYSGFWKLASKNMKEGLKEIYRSFHKNNFVANLQSYIPNIEKNDLIPATAGVRAQALKKNGFLVDDFHIIQDKNMLHICNAPSPAATASIEIGNKIINDMVEKSLIK